MLTCVLFEMLAEPREQVARVVRTRARLGVVLHAEDRLAGDGDAFVAVIEQVLVRDVHARRQRRRRRRRTRGSAT